MIDFDGRSGLQLYSCNCYVSNPQGFNKLSDCTRADSMARFKELQKQYAGIETVVDIAKSKWE